jgi:hypothetical protein
MPLAHTLCVPRRRPWGARHCVESVAGQLAYGPVCSSMRAMIMLHVHRRRFHHVTFLGLAVLWLLRVSMSGTEAAEPSFSNASLHGAYGFSSSGTLFGDPGIAVGRTTFDGQGLCTLVIRFNIAATGGTEPIDATACTYGVQPDGTGTLTVAIPGLGTFTIAFVLVDHGKELHTISLDPGISTTALLKKQ